MIDYTKLKFTVIDLETSIKNRGDEAVGSNKAAPYHPDNKVVWYGSTTIKTHDNIRQTGYLPLVWLDGEFKMGSGSRWFEIGTQIANADLLVGHNIKFDLQYLNKNIHTREQLRLFLQRGGRIWDTMIAEYLITGQEEQFISLDKLSVKYGGDVKDSRLKTDYWDKDIDTENIPPEIILPYLRGDLRNTAHNFMTQLERIKDDPTVPDSEAFWTLMDVQMNALLATWMIEENGIFFDVYPAMEAAVDLSEQLEELDTKLKTTMATVLDEQIIHAVCKEDGLVVRVDIEPEDVNPGSVRQIGILVAGGKFKVKREVPVLDSEGNPVNYKSGPKKGTTKFKMKEIHCTIDKWDFIDTTKLEKTPTGQWSLDEKALKRFHEQATKAGRLGSAEFLLQVLEYRSLQKELKVSYLQLIDLTWPTDSCIHGNFNHCSTHTGRLSSSGPNQQNFSGQEVEE